MRHLAILLVTLAPLVATAEDWPAFRGANRQGKSAETKLLASWPAEGPKLLWSVDGVGVGYSSPTVAHKVVYLTGMIGETGYLFAFDAAGKQLWKTAYGPETKGAGYPGSRSAPTVDGDRVYLTSGMGLIGCYDAATGARRWSHDLLERFGAKNIQWGISENLLVDGAHVIACPGGPKAMVALDKLTGETVWTTSGLDLPASYVSPVLMPRAGRTLVVGVYTGAIVGVDRADGKVLWQHPFTQQYGVLCVSPILRGDLLFTAAGFTGAVTVEVAADGSSAKELWSSKTFDITHGAAVELDGFLYGTSSVNPKGKWMCVEMATGKVRWTEEGVGKGSVIAADGMLYCYGERTGELALVRPDPTKLDVVSKFVVTRGASWHWGHPAISDRRLYVRRGPALMCFDIAAD